MREKKFALGVLATAIISTLGYLYVKSDKLNPDGVILENIEALSGSEETIITCGLRENYGRCWQEGFTLRICQEYFYYECEFTGMQANYCKPPC